MKKARKILAVILVVIFAIPLSMAALAVEDTIPENAIEFEVIVGDDLKISEINMITPNSLHNDGQITLYFMSNQLTNTTYDFYLWSADWDISYLSMYIDYGDGQLGYKSQSYEPATFDLEMHFPIHTYSEPGRYHVYLYDIEARYWSAYGVQSDALNITINNEGFYVTVE